MHRFTFQIETDYAAKRPQDLDCVGLLEHLRAMFTGEQRQRAHLHARVFGKRTGANMRQFARA